MTKGTREWAAKTINIQTGCEAGCIYCYAREAADRRKQYAWNSWTNTILREHDITPGYKNKYDGWVMFPSTHNIDNTNILPSVHVIHKLLKSGNNVLLVMKPHNHTIHQLMKLLGDYRHMIEFRFSISTRHEHLREIFEPHASHIKERIGVINLLYANDWRVSVSVEPFLDKDPEVLVTKLTNIGSKETDIPIWVGPMNHRQRLYKVSPQLNYLSFYLEKIYSVDNLIRVYKHLSTYKNVTFKDGFMTQMYQKR
jgi:hypothetical protein